MNIGLFFGSFNPIHIGHLLIAHLIHQSEKVDQIWFVISPQNPFKDRKSLLHEFDRLEMVRAATYEQPYFQVSDIEFNMPKPSYTIDTLTYLKEKYPQHHFKLILGEDNLTSFHKWKNADQILQDHSLIIYPRPVQSRSALLDHEKIEKIDLPFIDISSTLIRKMVKNQKSIHFLVPNEVEEIIKAKKYYQY